jgi:hypothetical protein
MLKRYAAGGFGCDGKAPMEAAASFADEFLGERLTGIAIPRQGLLVDRRAVVRP